MPSYTGSWWSMIPNVRSIDDDTFQLFTAEGKPIVGAVYSKKQPTRVHRPPGISTVIPESLPVQAPYMDEEDGWVHVFGRKFRKCRMVD